MVPPGTGIHLNNMLGEEDLNPLGFHRHEPGTRVTSMMAPTVVLRDGEVELALGSGGSNRLRSAILQVIRYVVDYGMDDRGGGARGRMHYEGGILHAEGDFDDAALDRARAPRLPAAALEGSQPLLRRRSCRLETGGDPATGREIGAGDPRRDGAAVTA